MTACTSPLLTASETPLRISRPSTLTRKSLISKSAIVSVSLPTAAEFKANSVLLRRIAIERNPQGIDRERGALHASGADLDPELLQQVVGRKGLHLVERFDDNQVSQYRGRLMLDRAVSVAEANLAQPA